MSVCVCMLLLLAMGNAQLCVCVLFVCKLVECAHAAESVPSGIMHIVQEDSTG